MLKFSLLIIATVITSVQGLTQEIVHSEQVTRCLKNKKASDLKVLTDNNPYYLLGDFDGDGKPDYALEVGFKKGGTGILICSGNGKVVLLGNGIGGGKRSDMPNDNLLAPHRDVKECSSSLSSFLNCLSKSINLKRIFSKVSG